jgi:hypothetical protein
VSIAFCSDSLFLLRFQMLENEGGKRYHYFKSLGTRKPRRVYHPY